MSVPVPITVAFESTPGTPLVAPAVVPTIRIRRDDTGVLVVTDAVMTELGDGVFHYEFTPPVDGISYAARANGDPTGVTQVPAESRYSYGGVNNRVDELWTRMDLNPAEQQTYENDGSIISNSEFVLTKTDNGDCTFDIVRS